MAIIAAVDDSKRAENVVSEAESLAKSFGETIHVVHVLSKSEFIELEQKSVDSNNNPIPMEDVRQMAAEIASQEVPDGAKDVTPVGLVGDAAKQVIKYAEKHNARYIVVAPRKRSPVGKAVFGSFAQTIILNSSCPVVSTGIS